MEFFSYGDGVKIINVSACMRRISGDEVIIKMLITKKSSYKTWIAKEIGTVKQEPYDKKGNLDDLQLLTSLQK